MFDSKELNKIRKDTADTHCREVSDAPVIDDRAAAAISLNPEFVPNGAVAWGYEEYAASH